MNSVKLIVPCSTSNLGPGFDTLGLALDWYLSASGTREGSGVKISFDPSVLEFHDPLQALVLEALAAWEIASSQKAEGLVLNFQGDLPLARGLGSSAAYRLAALTVVNALNRDPLSGKEVLELACRLEKHTDNAVPCAAGGLTISGWDGDGGVRYLRHAVNRRYRFVALCPELRLPTAEARAALPGMVPREDAVFNLQRALWLTSAFSHDQPEHFAGVFQDRLHQPYREKLVPFLPKVISAAEGAGALGAFLSGAGSTIIALTDAKRAKKVGEEMLAALNSQGHPGFVRVLKADHLGLRFLK